MTTQKRGFILLLDSGNTRLKCRAVASLDATQSLAQQILAEFSILNAESQQLVPILRGLQAKFGDLSHVYGVSVAGDALQKTWEGSIRQVNGSLSVSPITWLSVTQLDLGLYNHYALTQIGKDRWYGVLGAYTHYLQYEQRTGFIYISFGTATTIDAVMNQDYVGGVIFPGVQLMQKSLFQGTAQLPEVQLPTTPAVAFPKATYPAIEAGITVAQAGAVMRQVQKFYGAYQSLPSLFVSGGARKGVMAEIAQAYQEWADLLGMQRAPVIELETPVLDGIHSSLLAASRLS